jgi:hypothetical protein
MRLYGRERVCSGRAGAIFLAVVTGYLDGYSLLFLKTDVPLMIF